MSYLVEPQTNTSVLAEIITQIDPAQHDAVYLMNQILQNQVANSTAIMGLQNHSLDDWRHNNTMLEHISVVNAHQIEIRKEINKERFE